MNLFKRITLRLFGTTTLIEVFIILLIISIVATVTIEISNALNLIHCINVNMQR